ncbi:sensor histidine kinase [Edaphobacter albus]|uniref:sensor histidine kinase n=1 Tax=Edaphobacter sp. 4G125 TaxID=2763071 RepID=UPI001646CE5E|nr:HAMP domain-containing sensor histidine kinase [Edaphobacter sp. 4G125]QNI38127.1 HAMP domain-containing histidine kinase [Edaphobacter sp. 4G125]
MNRPFSMTRRLILTVLTLELLAAAALIGTVAIHERQLRLNAFDTALTGTAQTLFGAVQDADDISDNLLMDMRGIHLTKNSVFRVEDEKGNILGTAGIVPSFSEERASIDPTFHNAQIKGQGYRFVVLHGIRIIDPGTANGGTEYRVTVTYGMPTKHLWHEVLEATRFLAIATILLLSITAVVLAWMVRKSLSPVYELAHEAGRINLNSCRFDPPASAKEITELRPLANALEAALSRLQDSFQQQRRLTHDAAHELKTDLAIVKSSMQLLRMRKRSQEEYDHGLIQTLDDLTRLETTIQKMLTLARLEQPSSNTNDKPTSCIFWKSIEAAAQQVQPFAEIKEINISTELYTKAEVPVDSRDAILLCSNLLMNALQHSPEGSVIRVTLTSEGPWMKLFVQDEGEGIHSDDLPHIFEPFYRGDPSRSRKSGGSGLGLSICKAICDRAGGSIQILNRLPQGASVTVSLPALIQDEGPSFSASLTTHS